MDETGQRLTEAGAELVPALPDKKYFKIKYSNGSCVIKEFDSYVDALHFLHFEGDHFNYYLEVYKTPEGDLVDEDDYYGFYGRYS